MNYCHWQFKELWNFSEKLVKDVIWKMDYFSENQFKICYTDTA